jgi:hypothetical protein
MPKETVKVLMGAARSKSELLAKSPLQYVVLSVARMAETESRSA